MGRKLEARTVYSDCVVHMDYLLAQLVDELQFPYRLVKGAPRLRHTIVHVIDRAYPVLGGMSANGTSATFTRRRSMSGSESCSDIKV
jgi:hypothetical protein